MINLPHIGAFCAELTNLLKQKYFYAAQALIAAANVWLRQTIH